MVINIKKGNLFDLDAKYSLAQCISQDTNNSKSWGLGIVQEFRKRFPGIKEYTNRVIKENKLKYPCVIPYTDDKSERIIFNLVTKRFYYSKPNYETIKKCIEDMAYICRGCDIKYLGIPKLGCGLDKLQWKKVKEIIEEVFSDMDIEIEIRYL